MSLRDPSWTDAQAEQQLELILGDAEQLQHLAWEPGGELDQFFVEAFGDVVLEPADDVAYFSLFLEQGAEYDLTAFGATEATSLDLFDSEGYLLLTDDVDDIDDLLSDLPGQDTIWHFSPDETGTYFIAVNAEHNNNQPALLSVSATSNVDTHDGNDNPYPSVVVDRETSDREGHIYANFIVDSDEFFWDASIYAEQGVERSAAEAQLYRAYLGGFGRIPDAGGYAWWLDQIATGKQTLTGLAAGFIGSDEFQSAVDRDQNGSITPVEFLDHLYDNLFGRVPDPVGYEWWRDQIRSGSKSLPQVFVDMTQSNEYVLVTAEQVGDFLFA